MIGIEKAKEAFNNSYSPYSNFKVGAALELLNGEFILGTNIENASYGLTNCAERTALFTAYAKGYTKKDFKALYIIAKYKEPISPCGACRQVLAELVDCNMPIYLANFSNKLLKTSIKELLPLMFDLEGGRVD